MSDDTLGHARYDIDVPTETAVRQLNELAAALMRVKQAGEGVDQQQKRSGGGRGKDHDDEAAAAKRAAAAAAALVREQQREIDAYVRQARTAGDFARALDLTTQAQAASGNSLTRLINLQTQHIAITNQQAAAEQRAAAAAQQAAQAQTGSTAGVASSLTGLFTPLAGVAAGYLCIGAAAGQVRESFNLVSTLDQTEKSLGVLLGSQERANQVFDDAAAFAERYKIKQEDIAVAVQGASRIIKASQQPVEDVLGALARLQTLNPEETIAGAARALSEISSGSVESLVERFNVARSSANDLKAAIEGGIDPVVALDAFLNQQGVTLEALAIRTQGAAGQQTNSPSQPNA